MPSRASASSSTIEINGASDISRSEDEGEGASRNHQIKAKHIIHESRIQGI